jgi:GT2 family glycosyltransferase
MDLCVVILNYRRASMTLEALGSLEGDLAGRADRCAVVVDNASDDGSADALERQIEERGWSGWARVVRSPVNGGFAAGNNLGVRAVDAAAYLLLNSDARVRPGAVDELLRARDEHPAAGMIGPRLEDPDGTPQQSCFRYRTPISEMLEAAGTGILDRLLHRWVVARPVSESPVEAPWVSFACILVRREVVERIGPMDERYFMYFEDIDYARHARAEGWTVLHWPAARVVHLRGGTSSVKGARSERRRVPAYYYQSRSRYFAKFYGGRAGLWLTNMLWLLGRSVAKARELIGGKAPHACVGEWRDNWINALRPLRRPGLPGGGEL